MSVDVSLADPTSPVAAASTLSAWDKLRLQIAAEQAVKAAAERRDMGPTLPPTAAELRGWLARYNDWLDTAYVQNHGALANWVRTRKADTLRQLADLTAGGTK